ncbi:Putative transcriptional regulator yvhJ [Dermatophilus congolensis]|uniref:Transcriptional regulator yvhJ n=1 Tax=Dermatophilus congolensis TaxID=1863 RepID=A0AA46H1I9_9MICO|nr:LCP family protein [Dermatophilus congolensis]STD15569.1 Putative transcriptional regulator yvhJ [Dermatophilus congolensis]
MTETPNVRQTVIPRPAAQPRRLRTFMTRILAGTILPGAGLMLSGRTLAGGLFLSLFVLGIVASALTAIAIGPTKAAILVATNPTLLIPLAIAAGFFILLLIASLIWTADLNWPSSAGRTKKILAGLTAFLLIAALIAPTARAMQYVFITSNLVGNVFSASAPKGKEVGIGKDPWAGIPHVNVLLVGSDAQKDRPGVRTDSIMMASIDAQTGDTLLVSIPRNLENAPFPSSSPLAKIHPNGFRCKEECLLNEVWTEGEEHAHLYPGDPRPGLTALKESISEITGLTPDYSVVIDMKSFQALVNAMGGVDINVKHRIPIGGEVANGNIVPGSIKGWIEPGVQHLDGYHAMWYARGRATTDDYNRTARQRCMVNALVKQVDPWTMIDRFPQVAAVINEHIHTDVPQDHLPAWADLVEKMQKGKIRSFGLNASNTNVANPDYQHIREMIQASMFGQPLPTPTYTDGRAVPPAFRSRPTPSPTPENSTSTSSTTTPAPATPIEDATDTDAAAAC